MTDTIIICRFSSKIAEVAYVCCINYNVFGLILSGITPIKIGWFKPSSTFTGSETTADPNPSGATSVTMTAQWLDLCSSDTTKELVDLAVNASKSYDYSGNGQCSVLMKSGYYKLETWGAGGGTANNKRGGYGSYSVGVTNIDKNNPIYVYVGGGGVSNKEVATPGGYNGGGEITWTTAGSAWFGTAGGATHMAKVPGLLKDLSAYKDTDGTNVSKEILLVSGGGGGATASRVSTYCRAQDSGTYAGGDAGGMQSKLGEYEGLNGNISHNATQTGGYAFGLGYNRGGGGWYGGYQSGQCGGGGGGSGYIGSSSLISGGGITKHMTCYSCTTSTATATRTNSNTNVSGTATVDYSKTGNGYARITYLGTSI